MAVTVPEIMVAMAAKIDALPGIDHGYPGPPAQIYGDGVSVVLFWDETAVVPDMKQRNMWLPLIRGQILIAQRNDTLDEFPIVWAQVTPVMEAFSAGNISQVLPSLSGHVDRIAPAGRERPMQGSMQATYAGKSYLCSEVFWSVKFHRSVTP